MDLQTLSNFRQQVFKWTESRLDSGRYPFRRVEALPEILCSSGVEIPDLVLWINRDSGLAGAIILLPAREASSCMRRGSSIAEALGLQHFVLWDALAITIWEAAPQDCLKVETLELTPTKPITPFDFEHALEQLLEKLKLLAVAGMLPAESLPSHYFANLCEMTRQNVLPEQTEASRLTADGNQSDLWATKVPDEKIWLTMWRLLFLLLRGLMPPNLQPNRLEHAMRYAFADLDKHERFVYSIEPTEPDLTEAASICFHHLGNRLQQLEWPADIARAGKTVELLMERSAATFMMSSGTPPWPPESTDLAVNCTLPIEYARTGLVASRAFLAGWNLLVLLNCGTSSGPQARTVYQMSCDVPPENTIAHLQDSSAPPGDERQKRLIALRGVWPNHRFNLPRHTPAWIWEALHLSGLTSASGRLQLSLPNDWTFAPGANILWTYLLKRRQLLSYGHSGQGEAQLLFGPPGEDELTLLRTGGPVRITTDQILVRHPGLLNYLLNCTTEVLQLFLDGHLVPLQAESAEELKAVEKETYLFFHTSTGRHIWQHQVDKRALRKIEDMSQILRLHAPLLPAADVLGAFAMLDWQPGQPLPDRRSLDQILLTCWQRIPSIDPLEKEQPESKTRKRSGQKLRQEITALVFQDGLPLFPEHYLMQHYRPELHSYEIPGPLEYHHIFFGRVFLHTASGMEIEVENETTAKALQILSRMARSTVQLPVEASLTDKILSQYLRDLEKLWKSLLRECRRRIPIRQQALSVARKIWKDHNLPPRELLEQSSSK